VTVTTTADDWTELISRRDSRTHTVEVQQRDHFVAFSSSKPQEPEKGVTIESGGSQIITPGDGQATWIKPVGDVGGKLRVSSGGRVMNQPRRNVERPDDASVRAGNANSFNQTGSGLGAGSQSTTYTVAENTTPGVYRLQTATLAETSGAWDPNVRLVIEIQDSAGNVTDTYEAGLAQLPWNFPTPVLIPETFTAKAYVVNGSESPISYRITVAYTEEVTD